MSERMKYVVALVVGLLAIPGLAFAASSATSSRGPEGTAEVLGSAVATTTTTDASVISAEDLVRACGVEGHYLVELEALGAIDEIQLAALNALRPICTEAGLPLPDAPVIEGETIVETVTVVKTVPGPAAAPAVSAGTTSTTMDPTFGDPDDDAAEALAARERALAAIDTAMADRGTAEKINEAIALVEQGDAAYAAGDYDTAEELYEAAEDKAAESRYEDDDHEDDDHEDDD